MKEQYRQAVNAMRDEGYLVIIWTPEELGDIDASHVEDALIERGNDMITDLQPEQYCYHCGHEHADPSSGSWPAQGCADYEEPTEVESK
jgi:hypothetical protein